MKSFVFVCLAMAALQVASPSDAPANRSDEKQQQQRWLEYYRREAAAYEMWRGGPDGEKLKLEPAPLLHYTNDVRGNQQHGAVFVWTFEGRPEVVGSVWSGIPPYDRTIRAVTNEFVSLSEQTIASTRARRVGRRGVVPDWNATEPGIRLQRFAEAAAPAPTSALRLIQMRKLAAAFEARTNGEDEQQPLRLLPQPLYRYESDSLNVVDGALFAYVLSTDPELILVVEARESDTGPAWEYAFARLANLPLEVTLDQRPAWSCGKAEPYVGDKPYFLYWGVTTRGLMLD